jgi:hypothetical protein
MGSSSKERTMLGVMGNQWLGSENIFIDEMQAIRVYEEMEL